MATPAYLVLEDGTIFQGISIGAHGATEGEVVFNTSMTGYQEILTDPSYCKQIVTLTYPHIGNVGANQEDWESKKLYSAGLVIRDLPVTTSNWRSEQSLQDYLISHNIVAIANIDTRSLTRRLREKGSLNGVIATGEVNIDELLKRAQSFAGLKGMDLAKQVTTNKAYAWRESVWSIKDGYAASGKAIYKVAALDYGVKHNILRILTDLGCEVDVLPAQTSFEELSALNPDGVFLSNGPGDPEPCDYAITMIKKVIEANIPTFGICLGHQLFGLACGASTVKMKFGHHGANHPVKDLESGRVMISSQNHGFAVDENSLPDTLIPTHRSLFDGSLQGVRHRDVPAYSFQGHPEASPGPHDVRELFQPFVDAMDSRREA
ncbi:MAG: glutamine-hydrolyzing carbamoyl-phosphate synthase small subunit [Gammaproteobacteria bacterium]|nr:glutamine-hydrolyzing carbamoyl-phosphate synthase small subunit [Gammaproteobacteria bacterium]